MLSKLRFCGGRLVLAYGSFGSPTGVRDAGYAVSLGVDAALPSREVETCSPRGRFNAGGGCFGFAAETSYIDAGRAAGSTGAGFLSCETDPWGGDTCGVTGSAGGGSLPDEIFPSLEPESAGVRGKELLCESMEGFGDWVPVRAWFEDEPDGTWTCWQQHCQRLCGLTLDGGSETGSNINWSILAD
jgi:hypothetical protein